MLRDHFLRMQFSDVKGYSYVMDVKELTIDDKVQVTNIYIYIYIYILLIT